MNVPDQFDLSGRIAVVTGGTRGIGLAIAEGLASTGATVVPTSRTESDVEAAIQTVESHGVDSLAVPTDVTDDDDVRALFEQTADAFGGIDVVVNNAGVNPASALGRPENVDPEGYDFVLDVNLRGAFRCAQEAAAYLGESDGGSLINIASVGGLVGLPRQHPYVASKHGLVGVTKSIALDWAPDVRANVVAPGYVATELTAEVRENDTLRQSIVDRTPLDRFADLAELAGPVVFLASDAASYVTGTCLAVDGGWTAR
ncbi:SDR family NAD(P)-dependent oxidoreductase [Haladaptatus halobius]|uniref:SDR family NAD(P)-dependent oxidoreductase n=1 Tax=Haladaptatus halobius TaxID=2884875 RepID=UPI001D0A93B6|nr:glucose 1-dehydrogenase [Haladaptatus halobius]